jgi:hypothetical protein
MMIGINCMGTNMQLFHRDFAASLIIVTFVSAHPSSVLHS